MPWLRALLAVSLLRLRYGFPQWPLMRFIQHFPYAFHLF